MNYFAMRDVPINQINRYQAMRIARNQMDGDGEEDTFNGEYEPTAKTVGSFMSMSTKYNNLYGKHAADRFSNYNPMLRKHRQL